MKERVFTVTKEDFDVQVFRSGGKGGQNQNKVSSGVRIVHRASGAKAESREYRDQPQNKKAAFRRLVETPAFKTWLRIETSKAMLSTIQKRRIEKEVEEWMDEKYLKVESF